MEADFSIELGRDDAVLDFPWRDPAGKLAYVDLKRHPELMARIEEAERLPQLGEFLRTLNSPPSMVETAKCDVWTTSALSAEEEIFRASIKFASYVDLVFCTVESRLSFRTHEQFATNLVALLQPAPETGSAAEVCVRRCYFGGESELQEGFYCTLYVSGYGHDDASARQNWAMGLSFAGKAILQLSAGGS